MGKACSCTPELRKVILNLKKRGFEIAKIAETIGRSRKLVYNALSYYEKHKTTEKVMRKPPPRKTSQREDSLIVREAKRNPLITSEEIRKNVKISHNIDVSSRTIRRRLNEHNLRGCVAQKKPLVSKKNLKARLQFAKTYATKPINFWKNVLWSDESKFNRFGSDGKRIVWRPPNKQHHPMYTVKTVKHGGGSVMVWAAFSWRGVGPIVKINGIMDQYVYKNILENHMEPFVEENMPLNWTFMHDNDPKHSARSVKAWLNDQKIKTLPWPAQSPDLNPIENLWNDVETQIKLVKPKNLNELWETIRDAWSSISPDRCKRLVESLPRRLNEVIRQKGFPTKY